MKNRVGRCTKRTQSATYFNDRRKPSRKLFPQGDAMNSIAKKTTIQIALLCLLSSLALSQETPAEYQEVLKIVEKSGDYKANVLKVNIPRNDLHVKVSGYALPTPF